MNQLWFVSRDSQVQGPFSSAQLRQQVQSGQLQPQHLLMLQGNKNWVKAASIKGLFPPTTAVTVSPVVSKNPSVAKPSVAAAQASSSKASVVIAVLAIACVPLALVLAGGVAAAVWFFQSSDAEPEVTASLTSAEPARAEAMMPNNPGADAEPKAAPQPGGPGQPNDAPRPGLGFPPNMPLGPGAPGQPNAAPRPGNPLPSNEALRPGGPGEPKEAKTPPPEVRIEPPKEAPPPVIPAPPTEAPRAEAGPDVDALVKLLGQDVIVGSTTYRRPPDAEWIAAIKNLQSSSNPAVVAAVKALTTPEGTATGRAFAIKLVLKVRAETDERFKKLHESGKAGGLGLLDQWADDEQLRDAEQAGFLSRAEADAYREARNRAKEKSAATWGAILTSAIHELDVDNKVRAIRKRAEVLEGHVFVEHLASALRARAGAKTEDAPLEFTYGILPDRKHLGEELGLLCGSSKAKQELTNVTLLLTVRGAYGARYVAVFLPRLAPGESFRVLPFAAGVSELRATEFKKPPAEAVGRYSIWCDQLTVENQALPETAMKDGIFAYAAQTILTHRAFVADPPSAYRNYQTAAMLAQRRNQQAPNPLLYSRFGIAFTDLKPKGEGYLVKAEFARYDLEDNIKIADAVILSGTLRKSPLLRNPNVAVLVPDAICELQGRGNQLLFTIVIPPDGDIALVGKSFPFEGRNLVPAEQAKKGDDFTAKFRRQNVLVNKARQLAWDGKKEEATKILNEVLADSPSRGIESDARTILRNLDQMAKEGNPRRRPVR